MKINTFATRGESIYSICKTDFNNCGVAIVTGLINLNPKALLFLLKEKRNGNSLVGQWLGLCASTEGSTASIPGQGTKITHVTMRPKRKRERVTEKEIVEYPKSYRQVGVLILVI